MEPDSAFSYKPWLHQQNHSSSSPIARGMDLGALPGNFSRLASHHYAERLDPTPNDIPFNRYWNENTKTWETPIHREMTASRQLLSSDTKLPPTITRTPRTSRRYSREGAISSVPPLTPSSCKILQMTGSETRFERAFPEKYQRIDQRALSPAPSNYSESLYDEAETSLNLENEAGFSSSRKNNEPENYRDIVQEEESRWSSGDSLPNPEQLGRGILRPFYKVSEQMDDAISSVTSLRHKERPTKAHSKKLEQNENTTLRDLLAEERAQQDERRSWSFENSVESQCKHELREADFRYLMPEPLVLRPKRQTKKLSLNTKNNRLKITRDPVERDIDEMLSSMQETKLYNTPITSVFNEGNNSTRMVPPPLKIKHTIFGTGNHPLKSPFPFRHGPAIPETIDETCPNERTFNKRITGAMKHLWLSPTYSQRGVISNGARRPSGPDTPLPGKSPFKAFFPSVETKMQKGGVHIQEAVTKVKRTVRFKSSVLRKRESLKKSIVYVGISDQSPGMTSKYEQ
jgi:hypothetical protein